MSRRLIMFTLCGAIVTGSAPAAQQHVQIGAGQAQPFPGRPQMPARDAEPDPTGTASIRGRVVSADLGTPLRRAHVRLTSPEIRVGRVTTTDAEGRYEFRDLPGARYSLQASKGGYVSVQYGQRRVLEAGRPVEVGDGQRLDRVDFVLPRGGVIVGRISDEFGEPMAEALVQASTYRYTGGARRLVPIGSISPSNDIGEFRLFGLPPGDYYVSATTRPMGFGDIQAQDASGYAPTYYPGTPSVSEAQRLTVGVGLEVHAHFALTPARMSRIAGTVRDSSDKPFAGTVMLVQALGSGVRMFGGGGGPIKPDGTFMLSNVAPGEYTLNVGGMGGPLEGGEFASVPLTVTGTDITGLTIRTSRGATIRGWIATEHGVAPTFSPQAARIIAAPADPDTLPFGMGAPPRTNDDWTFEIRSLAGLRLFRAAALPPGWSLKAVRLNGVDITDTPLEFGGTEEVSDLEVLLTNQATRVTGHVSDDRGTRLKDYSVVIFARDPERWGFQSRFLRASRPDQDGRYEVQGLPAGDYLAVALDYIEQGEWMDPEVLESLRLRATPFSLNDGDTRTLDLKLSTS